MGRSLWEFVGDVTTRQVYRDLLARVRGGRTVSFPYRCDSPSLRRFMRMTMMPGAGNSVAFEGVTLRAEPRVLPMSTGPADPPIDALVRMCSWCKRVAMVGEWVELQLAV